MKNNSLPDRTSLRRMRNMAGRWPRAGRANAESHRDLRLIARKSNGVASDDADEDSEESKRGDGSEKAHRRGDLQDDDIT